MEALAIGFVLTVFSLVYVVCELLKVCERIDEELEDVN